MEILTQNIGSVLSAAGLITLTTDTLANIITNYPPSSYAGCQANCTDAGINTIRMISNGTQWVPLNGRALIDRLTLSVVKAPTFTGTTNGAITWGTAAGKAFAKCFCYYPANSLVASHAAGFYYTEMSTTTEAIVYDNTYTPAAGVRPTEPVTKVAFSGAVPGGAGSTAEITGFIYPIVGNLLGKFGNVICEISAEHSSNANTKYFRHYLASTLMNYQFLTTSATMHCIASWRNAGSENAQRGNTSMVNFTSTAPPSTSTTDTTIDQLGSITFATQSSSDWAAISLANISVEVA